MTEESMAIVEGFLDAVERADMPAALGHLDPEVEWSAPAGLGAWYWLRRRTGVPAGA